MTGRARHVDTCEVMGTVASVHVIGADRATAAAAARDCFAVLRRADRVFSTYDDGSDVRRIARADLDPTDADPWVADVRAACLTMADETGGLFDAWRHGWFDPTGVVKGWAAERAARQALGPLVRPGGAVAAALDVGGDMQVFSADDGEHTWNVGIVDPSDRRRVIATVPIRNGAIATSGSAERGAHIIDPRTGSPATGIVSATVLADGLTRADVWATAAVAAGIDGFAGVLTARDTSGMTVDRAGHVRRWITGTEAGIEVCVETAGSGC